MRLQGGTLADKSSSDTLRAASAGYMGLKHLGREARHGSDSWDDCRVTAAGRQCVDTGNDDDPAVGRPHRLHLADGAASRPPRCNGATACCARTHVTMALGVKQHLARWHLQNPFGT